MVLHGFTLSPAYGFKLLAVTDRVAAIVIDCGYLCLLRCALLLLPHEVILIF
jgi:hypothetical protein